MKAFYIHYDLHGSRRWGTTCWIRQIWATDQDQALAQFWQGRFGPRRRQDVEIRQIETQADSL